MRMEGGDGLEGPSRFLFIACSGFLAFTVRSRFWAQLEQSLGHEVISPRLGNQPRPAPDRNSPRFAARGEVHDQSQTPNVV